jgi:hypothetical protein
MIVITPGIIRATEGKGKPEFSLDGCGNEEKDPESNSSDNHWVSVTMAKRMKGKTKMTVRELKEKLSKLDDKATIYVYLEEGTDHQFYGIDEVAERTGEPSRRSNGKVGFRFDPKGPVTWPFISISHEWLIDSTYGSGVPLPPSARAKRTCY